MCSNISTDTTRSNRPGWHKPVHVGGDDVEIGEPFAPWPRPAMKARCECELDTAVILRRRIMPRHPQRQRAPAAAEFEDALAVGERRRARQ